RARSARYTPQPPPPPGCGGGPPPPQRGGARPARGEGEPPPARRGGGPPPAGGAPPVVRAVIPAEPPEVNQQYGGAMWVKVFVTESESEVELHHLVTDDPAVPQDASETETEWAILQAGPGGTNNEPANEGPVGANRNTVTPPTAY